MDADPEGHPSSSLSPTRSTIPAYRIFLGDTDGALKLFNAQCAAIPPDFQPPFPILVNIIDTQIKKEYGRTGADRAVQKMASGNLKGVGWVIAIARKDATIDLVLPPTLDVAEHESSSSLDAVLLASIRHDKMKPGLQRWVGLAVGEEGIYACTSAGHFLYANLKPLSTSSSTRAKLQVSELQQLQLPEPLQAVFFHPPSNPTHFIYGGEEIPLSLWHLPTALSPERFSRSAAEDEGGPEADYSAPDGEEIKENNGNGGMNAKMRKRKRQAEARSKAKELLWGEVWRAKNLPNDSLSLPRRPNIVSISVLPSTTTSSPSSCSSQGETSTPDLTIVVGTRDGFLRVFEPASGVRKHTKEIRVVLPGQGSLKFVTCTECNSGEVVAADSAGNLYAVDVNDAGKVKYQWKDITGAITCALPLPAPYHQSGLPSESPLLFSASFDRLLRLHTLPSSSIPSSLPTKGYPAKGKNLYSAFTGGAGVVAAIWDEKVPVLLPQDEGDGDESMRSGSRRNGVGRQQGDGSVQEDLEDEEEVWSAMQEVGQDSKARRSRRRSSGKFGNGGEESGNESHEFSVKRDKKDSAQDEAEGEDEEVVQEGRSKRGKRAD